MATGEKKDKRMQTHDLDNKITLSISKSLDENIKNYEALFTECDDVVKRKMPIGKDRNMWVYVSYIDVMIDRRVVEESIMEQLIVYNREVELHKQSFVSVFEYLKDSGMATADVRDTDSFDDLINAVLSGDTIVMFEGFDKAIVIATRGWPNRGIPEASTEKVVRGSKESFSEVFRFNTVLIRRRIRDTKLKIKQMQLGIRSRTDIAVVYVEDIVDQAILDELLRKLNKINIDSVMESGILEQLIEDKVYSPFPQAQVTQRPDKVASAILEGRIAVIVDNTPFVLIVPTTLNCFFQSSEDYYNRWMIMSFVRVLRYIAGFLAICLPGLYIAITTFNPSMIPSALTFSIAASREGVPFPAVIEVLMMELAFELLREAGLRLPGAIGHTIGIVGGLIVGQAAVEANLISPIIVIIVALTAIASFSIPNDDLVSAIRLIKFFVIGFSAILGIYGFILAVLVLLIHLVDLKSFGIPYLSPFVMQQVNDGSDLKDSIIRMPLKKLNKRPIFSQSKEKVRYTEEKDERGGNDDHVK